MLWGRGWGRGIGNWGAVNIFVLLQGCYARVCISKNSLSHTQNLRTLEKLFNLTFKNKSKAETCFFGKVTEEARLESSSKEDLGGQTGTSAASVCG